MDDIITANYLQQSLQTEHALEEILRCMICFEPFQSPKVLQCHHTFCQLCLCSWYERGGRSLKGLTCPTCRASTALTDNEVSSLPEDFKMNKLSDALRQVVIADQTHLKQRKCDICTAMGKVTTATVYCTQCSENFCQQCNDMHEKSDLFSSHQVVDLQAAALSGNLFCKYHETRPVKFLCKQCQAFICTVCTMSTHADHSNVEDMQQSANKYVDSLSGYSKQIKTKLEGAEAIHNQLTSSKQAVEKHFSSMQELIKNHATGVKQQVEQCQTELQDKLKADISKYDQISAVVSNIVEAASLTISAESIKIVNDADVAEGTLLKDLTERKTALEKHLTTEMENLMFHLVNIESLSLFVNNLLTNVNPLEIITVHDELLARIKSLLQTDISGPSTIPAIRFMENKGSTELGKLDQHDVSLRRFLEEHDVCIPQGKPVTIKKKNRALGNRRYNTLASFSSSRSSSASSRKIMCLKDANTNGELHIDETAILEVVPVQVAPTQVAPSSPVPEQSSERVVDKIEVAVRPKLQRPMSEQIQPESMQNGFVHSQQRNSGSAEVITTDNTTENNNVVIPKVGADTSCVLARNTSFREETQEAFQRGSRLYRSSVSKSIGDESPRTLSPPRSPFQRESKQYQSYSERSATETDHDGALGFRQRTRVPSYNEDTERDENSLRGGTSLYHTGHTIGREEGGVVLKWIKDGQRSRRGSSKPKLTKKSTPVIRCPADVCFLSTGHVVTADLDDKNIQILECADAMFPQGKGFREPLVTTYPVAWGQVEPLSVSSMGTDRAERIAVTDNKERCIKMFTTPTGRTSQCLGTWGKGWFGHGFKQPVGITSTPSGNWVVTDVAKHSVSVHEHDGRCIYQFGQKGRGNPQLETPKYVTCDANGRIIISDCGNNSIKIFDCNGNFIKKFGQLGERDGQLKSPAGVCVDSRGNILVADRQNDRISMFSPDGEFIRQLIRHNGLVCVQNPVGIAINDKNHMAVTQTNPPSVKLFMLNMANM